MILTRADRTRTTQPRAPSALDLDHPAFERYRPTLVFNAAAGLKNLATNEDILINGAVLWDGKMGPAGPVYCASNADSAAAVFLLHTSATSPPDVPFTLIGVAGRNTGAFDSAILHTSTDGSNYEGVWFKVALDGTCFFGFGDGSGLTAADRRTFTTTTAPFQFRHPTPFALTVHSTTEASIFVRGLLCAYGVTGTATSYAPGNGSTRILSSQYGASGYGFGSVGMIMVLPGSLPDALLESLSINPWQLFAPEIGTKFFSGAIPQTRYERPDADVSDGAWLPSVPAAALYSMIDEASADDADYIYTGSPSVAEVALSDVPDPSPSRGHTIRVRMRSTTGDSCKVSLVQGSGSPDNIIATFTQALTSSFVTYELSLSVAQVESITDYADLRLRFEAI